MQNQSGLCAFLQNVNTNDLNDVVSAGNAVDTTVVGGRSQDRGMSIGQLGILIGVGSIFVGATKPLRKGAETVATNIARGVANAAKDPNSPA